MIKRWILAAVVVCSTLIPTPGFARVWRDQKGNVINAEFVKVERGMVYLKPERQYASPTPFPFYDFSEADQEFVKGILEKRGQLDRIPPPPPEKDKPGQTGAAKNSVPVTVVPNAARAPGNAGVPALPSGTLPDSTTAPAPSIPIAVTPTVPPSYTPPVNPTPAVTPARASIPTPTTAPRPAPGGSQFNPPFGPQFVEKKQCQSCKKEIPLTSTVGQKCPHCGVFWSEETNEFGRVVNRASNSDSNWMTSRGALRLAGLIGAFIIGGIVKAIRDSR